MCFNCFNSANCKKYQSNNNYIEGALMKYKKNKMLKIVLSFMLGVTLFVVTPKTQAVEPEDVMNMIRPLLNIPGLFMDQTKSKNIKIASGLSLAATDIKLMYELFRDTGGTCFARQLVTKGPMTGIYTLNSIHDCVRCLNANEITTDCILEPKFKIYQGGFIALEFLLRCLSCYRSNHDTKESFINASADIVELVRLIHKMYNVKVMKKIIEVAINGNMNNFQINMEFNPEESTKSHEEKIEKKVTSQETTNETIIEQKIQKELVTKEEVDK
jgi:hypothetical protein